MSYRMLVLPDTRSMTPQLLAKIKELVEAGAVVLGSKPSFSPSLRDYPACDAQVEQFGKELWADCDGKAVRERVVGKGRLFCGLTPAQVLHKLNVATDFATDQHLRYIHRATPDTDFYFISNPQAWPVTAECSFRVTGRTPEFWWPETGRVEPAAMFQELDGVTHVAVPLTQAGSVFVVFRNNANVIDPIIEVANQEHSISLAHPAKLIITKARYGVLDSQRTRDVTVEVQQLADQGQRHFQVATLAQTGDPASNVIKTLVVDYTLAGKSFSVKATDTQVIHLPQRNSPDGAAVGVTVVQARYGVLDDPKRTRDVRDRLQALIDSGESSFQVARMADGDDPAFGTVKTLEISLTANGRSFSLSGLDPDLIDLTAVGTPPGSALAIPRVTDSGIIIEAESGDYTWTRASGKTGKATAGPLRTTSVGPWQVQFGKSQNAVAFDTLSSWSENADPAIKYFSGTAVYTGTFDASNELTAGNRHVWLDLGKVQVMAQVTLNGKDLGVLWKPPYRVDVTGAVKTGQNSLQVRVVNLWINRMIGDEQLPEDSDRNPDGTLKAWPQWVLDGKASPTARQTFTSWRLWKKDSPLKESGLLGPVVLRSAEWIKAPAAP